MKPSDCDRYPRCSAPICPLDPDWPSRSMLKGEPVCFYLLEVVKEGSAERFQGAGRGDMYELARSFIEDQIPRCAPLEKPLERAKSTGHRLGKKIEKSDPATTQAPIGKVPA